MAQTRMTKQRAVILDVLRKVKSHPTADEVYTMVREKMPHVSLGTVYRNLEVLTAMGEIIRLDKAGAQKRFDGDLRPHFHVHCQCCGKVGDVFHEISVPLANSIEVDGFTLCTTRVEFLGVCDECTKSQ